MQVFRLPRQVTRAARLAARACADERSEEGQARAAALMRWDIARANGLTAAAAAQVVGVPRATLYRWQKRLEPQSRRPRHIRRPEWPAALVTTIRELRADYPMWGKAKLAVLIRRQGWKVSESTTGRILTMLMTRGAVTPVPTLRRGAPRAARRTRPYARRLPRGRKPTRPGEIVQIDTLSISPGHGRPPIKQFTATDPIAKWTCAKAHRRATAHNAARFLDKLQADMPFPIEAIQVDGGSEFKAGFETECRRRGIDLWELPPRSPELNGHVERNNGVWRYEFYAAWDLDTDDLEDTNRWIDAFADEFNTFRPHHALGGQTPQEYLAKHAANATPPSHMS